MAPRGDDPVAMVRGGSQGAPRQAVRLP